MTEAPLEVDLDISIERFADLARRLLGSTEVHILLLERERHHVATGTAEPPRPRQHRADSFCLRALRSLDPLVIADIQGTDRGTAGRPEGDPDVSACLGVPLVTGQGELMGSLCVLEHEPRYWSGADVANVLDLAAILTSDIVLRQALHDSHHSTGKTRRRQPEIEPGRGAVEHERRALLFQFAEALAGATDIDDIVSIVLDLGAVVLGAEYAAVGSVDDATNEIIVASNRSTTRTRLPLDDGSALSSAVRSRSPVVFTSVGDGATAGGGWIPDRAESFHSVLAHPLSGHRGGLCFGWHDTVELDDALRGAVHAMAKLTGQALERAVSYEHERRIADSLQRSLLPGRLPSIPGADIAARYEAGAAGIEVGGDWYDAVTLDEDRYVLVVGDVVGRGLRAAATMGQLRHTFSALTTANNELDSLIDNLDIATFDIEHARMSTMVAVEWIPAGQRIRCISAGHPPPLVRRHDGRVEQLPDAGPPLGFARGVHRPVIDILLGDGDAVLLYTDGLVERRGESLDVGLARLADVLSNADITSAQALCDEIYGCLGVEQNDDVAVLAMLVGTT